jgi:hypothetical protein
VARALILCLLLARVAHADCDLNEAALLRAHLADEAHRAAVWNWSWRIAFSTAALSTLGVALANPLPDYRDGLYVSAGKAGLAAAARWILPLRIDEPPPNADPCADLAALRDAVRRAAKHERREFWLNHIGGILVNGAGAVILTERRSLGQGLLSVAIGYPIGLLSNYTMPRNSWHVWRDSAWTVAVVPHGDGMVVLLSL